MACPSLEPQHVGSSARDEQAPDILVATSADTKQRSLPTGTVLPGNETNRRCKIATAPVLLAVSHFCGQNTGGDRADARDRQLVLADIAQTLKDRDQAWWQ